ncbi:hypothetical protein SBA4_810002 [Candidatus Sulfopaludibacter sp. SbA4]|nr:hypothetical protein SBA4_810002 [Candidatus Sulfopaludibacter sp. SbA4]
MAALRPGPSFGRGFRQEFIERLRPPRGQIGLRLFEQKHSTSPWRKVPLDFRIPRGLLATIKPPPQFGLFLRRQVFDRLFDRFYGHAST